MVPFLRPAPHEKFAKIKYAAGLSPQWHPGSQWHFNGSPYWKVSSGINGILKFSKLTVSNWI